ncbi:unnamed protein product [Symbiodinium sp. CCMP2592]|nr:unnamed protein product [Symbiodinium sp. CCMP2592]
MTSSQSTLKAIVANFPRPNEGFVSEPASWGSLGHPELCHRPCVYILKGSVCRYGASCQFCHHGPGQHSPMPKLDQEQRARLQGLSEEDRVSLLIPHIREKALAAGLPEEVEDFICVLKKNSNQTSHIEPYDDDHRRKNIPRKEFCRLKKTLRNMNLTALIKLLDPLLPTEDEELATSFQKLLVKFEL